MNKMFKNCVTLSNLKLPSSFNIQNVANKNEITKNCNSLSLNTQNVNNTINNLNLSSFNTQNINMDTTFYNSNNNLNNLNLSSFDAQKVSDINSMFNGSNNRNNLSPFNIPNVNNNNEISYNLELSDIF